MQEPQREANTGKNPRAFPLNTDEFFDRGMLLRDYFAAAALTGIARTAAAEIVGKAREGIHRWWAEQAYELADAMLAARRPKQPQETAAT